MDYQGACFEGFHVNLPIFMDLMNMSTNCQLKGDIMKKSFFKKLDISSDGKLHLLWLIAWVTVDPSTVKANLVATELEASSLPVFFGRKIAGTALVKTRPQTAVSFRWSSTKRGWCWRRPTRIVGNTQLKVEVETELLVDELDIRSVFSVMEVGLALHVFFRIAT